MRTGWNNNTELSFEKREALSDNDKEFDLAVVISSALDADSRTEFILPNITNKTLLGIIKEIEELIE